MRSRLILFAFILCPGFPVWSAPPDDNAKKLEDILVKLDRSAAAFHGMTADLKETAHTAVINEDQIESGAIRIKRSKPGDTRMLVDFQGPDAKVVQLQGQTLRIYLPKIQTVDEYDLGKNKALVDQFLLLGFGATRQDLAASNQIRYGGAETVRGQPAVRLELIPKSAEALQRFQKIDLWLSAETGYPLQHKIYQPGGDYQIFAFENLKMNPPDLSDASMKLKLPKDVRTERPQH